MLVGIASYAVTRDDILRLVGIECCAIWLAHFDLLSDFSAVAMMVLAIVFLAASALKMPAVCHLAFGVNVITALGAIVVAALGMTGWRPVLPMFGGLFINTAVSYLAGHA